jgi:alkanesulfonate monooxygenase SsuD/methylene tetrahydromethanopterin reductase-like flavin-dependent oxidoreductase (luciferase family)
MQLADPFIVEWAINAVRAARDAAGKDVTTYKVCVAAPAYVGDDLAHQRDQVRWFGGMVGNHVADIVERYGSESPVPPALTEYIKGRQGYDYRHHGQAGNPDTEFVPDEVIDRFCVLGPVEHHLERLGELAQSGVDQFSLYLMHDDPETTIEAYRTSVIGRV